MMLLDLVMIIDWLQVAAVREDERDALQLQHALRHEAREGHEGLQGPHRADLGHEEGPRPRPQEDPQSQAETHEGES